MTDFHIVPQDHHLAKNQDGKIRCGDNGIFKGVPMTDEQKKLTYIAEELYTYYPYDGKYILDGDRLIICQSNSKSMDVMDYYPQAEINPIGEWTGGSDVDAGATNKKLGSDMADSVTGGGLHGKDCSKADVSANIYCWLKAQETGEVVEACCAIGWTYKVRPTRCFEMLRYNTVIAKLLSTKGANPEPFEYYDLDNELGIVMMFYTNYLDNHEERASLGDRILYG